MKTSFVFPALLLAASLSPAIAGCVGSGSIQSCSDSSGNNYTVTRMGNQTIVHGYNASTGSTWNQTSTRVGDSTYTRGFDASGRSWNSTTRSSAGTVTQHGVDSDGNYFNNTYRTNDYPSDDD